LRLFLNYCTEFCIERKYKKEVPSDLLDTSTSLFH